MVAGNEKPLYRRAVAAAIFWENLAPGGGNGLELEAARPSGEVSGNEDSVDALHVETTQRLHEPFIAGGGWSDVNVRKDTDAQKRCINCRKLIIHSVKVENAYFGRPRHRYGSCWPFSRENAEASSPAMRPNTRTSVPALPPIRLRPWIPPVTSPAA